MQPALADPHAAFPYAPREHQRELVAFLHGALVAGRHAIAESGTGTGKTVCALSAALTAARSTGRRVLYLTRTNSQARQVMVEYRRVRAALGGSGTAVALQGRQHLCPLRREDGELEAADAEELGIMCRDRMRAAERVHSGEPARGAACRFHLRGLEEGSDALVAWIDEAAPDAEQLALRVGAAGQCPFVVTRGLLAGAELVVAPSIYALHPALRAQLLRQMGVAMGDLFVVVDEAHNVPQLARDLASSKLGLRTLASAEAETRAFGDPTVLRDIPLSRLIALVGEAMVALREALVPDGDPDALLAPEELDVHLLSSLRTSTPALDRALVLMDEYGAAVREAKRRAGKRPRSDVGTVARFLMEVRAFDPETHAAILEVEEDQPRIVLLAVDAALLAGALDEAAATVHLSGTLHPLDEYRDSLGLPTVRVDLARFPSPFPRENRLVLVDDTVTTRHEDVARDPALWDEMGARLRELRAAAGDRNVAVFLPSFEALHRLAPHVRGARSFVEARGSRQDELMAQVEAFRATRGGTLVSVVGGRLSEGMDFPDEELEMVVVVGLPYARPTAKLEALIRFYDRRFGRGWEWAVKVPMTRRVLQAAGRLIRTPSDRGVVVLLDRRAAMLRDVLPDALVTTSAPMEAARFFGQRKAS